MKDYKEKLQEFIDDLNYLLNGGFYETKWRGGKYVLSFTENNLGAVCTLEFKEKQDTLPLFYFKTDAGYDIEGGFNSFYQRCYISIFRMIMCGVDVGFGDLIDPIHNRPIYYLSFNTLAKEGLKQLREWNSGAKWCFSCRELTKQKMEKCPFCGEEFFDKE